MPIDGVRTSQKDPRASHVSEKECKDEVSAVSREIAAKQKWYLQRSRGQCIERGYVFSLLRKLGSCWRNAVNLVNSRYLLSYSHNYLFSRLFFLVRYCVYRSSFPLEIIPYTEHVTAGFHGIMFSPYIFHPPKLCVEFRQYNRLGIIII